MSRLILGSLFVLVASLAVEPANATPSKVTPIPSSIWLRDVSASLTELCASAKQDCAQESYTVDPYANNSSALEALKSGFAKESYSYLRIKYAPVATGEIMTKVQEMLTEAEITKNISAKASLQTLADRLKNASKTYSLHAVEAIGFSQAGQGRFLIIFIRNSRFDLGEALVFSTGPKGVF